MKIETRKELESLPSTVHGGQGWKLDGVEDYSQNLNPFGPPEDLPSILAECAKDTGHYPDADCTSVREAIARHYGLGPENVAMGAGSSEIIRNFPQVFIRPGESVLTDRGRACSSPHPPSPNIPSSAGSRAFRWTTSS